LKKELLTKKFFELNSEFPSEFAVSHFHASAGRFLNHIAHAHYVQDREDYVVLRVWRRCAAEVKWRAPPTLKQGVVMRLSSEFFDASQQKSVRV
jgi:hypothetical protein